MYNMHTNGLGEESTAAPSLWDSFSNILTKSVSAGFNIYNKVQNLTSQQKAAAQAQAMLEAAPSGDALCRIQVCHAVWGDCKSARPIDQRCRAPQHD